MLAADGVYLNYNGTYQLGSNFLKYLNNVSFPKRRPATVEIIFREAKTDWRKWLRTVASICNDHPWMMALRILLYVLHQAVIDNRILKFDQL